MKKLIKSSFIYLFLGFLPMAVNFFLSPLYSHVLDPRENAIIGQALIFQSFLAVFLSLSIDSAFTRYFYDYHLDDLKIKVYFSTILIFIILVSSVCFLLFLITGDYLFLYFQKNNIFTFSKYGIWAFISTFCTIVQSIFLTYYRNKENPKLFGLISLSFFFISLFSILVGILIFKAGALGSIMGRAIGYAIPTIILLVLFFNNAGFKFKINYLKESLQYSLPLIPYLLLMALYGNIDRILVERFFSLQELGIYNFAFLISGAVSVFISSGQNVVGPMVYKKWSEINYAASEISNIFSWYHVICVAVISIGLAMTVPFIEVLIDIKYWGVLNYIGPLFLAFIFRAYYILYIDSLFFNKKTKWIFLITLFSFIVGVASNLILIPSYGIMGVALSVMIINFIQACGARLQVYLYKINPEYYRLKLNHFYSICVVLTYFIAYICLLYFKIDLKYANYFPLLVTLIFLFYFLFHNKQSFKINLTKIRHQFKLP